MKNRSSKNDENDGKREEKKINCSKSMKNKKKNMMRLGGAAGLSLEAFANAKSTFNHYNPSIIKKRREFYKNAKYVSKYKKLLKKQSQQNDMCSAVKLQEEENETGESAKLMRKDKHRKKGSNSLRELYEKRIEEEDKARTEREAIIKAKKEERERAETRRKAARENMYKKTRYGQPVMKYRIEHLLHSIQGSNSNSVGT